jgi:hypothetical protein
MPKYIAHLAQDDEGCGHTIACGHKLIGPFEAESLLAAFELLTTPNEHGEPHVRMFDKEWPLVLFVVYEVAGTMEVDLEWHRALKAGADLAAAAGSTETAERAEFERLQKKFG